MSASPPTQAAGSVAEGTSRRTRTSVAPPESSTQQFPALRRFVSSSAAEITARIAIRPVFVDDGGRRRRLIVGSGYLLAVACFAYIVVVGVSLTAAPSGPLDRAPRTVAEAAAPPAAASAPAAAAAAAAAQTIAPSARTETLTRPTPTPTSVKVVTTTPARVAPTVAPTAATPEPPTTTTTTTTSPAAPTTTPCRPRRSCATRTTAPTADPEPPAVDQPGTALDPRPA